jgi:hypothetical protein
MKSGRVHSESLTGLLQASIMSRLQSRHVVAYVESGLARAKDLFWLVMELVEGEALDRVLEVEGPMPELEVVRVRTSKLLCVQCALSGVGKWG